MTGVNKRDTLREEAQQNERGEHVSKTVAENLNGLYQLSLLLTGDHDKAQQCVVTGIEECVSGNRAFSQWAHSWTKRIVIENAIRELKPRQPFAHSQSAETVFPYADELSTPLSGHFELEAILALEPFDRVVFVISVLEHYSDHECTLLLRCPVLEIRDARTRALEKLIDSLHISMHGDVSTQDTRR
jgi:DNA-directed RNA polymerase specialized sigma24 family protein